MIRLQSVDLTIVYNNNYLSSPIFRHFSSRFSSTKENRVEIKKCICDTKHTAQKNENFYSKNIRAPVNIFSVPLRSLSRSHIAEKRKQRWIMKTIRSQLKYIYEYVKKSLTLLESLHIIAPISDAALVVCTASSRVGKNKNAFTHSVIYLQWYLTSIA